MSATLQIHFTYGLLNSFFGNGRMEWNILTQTRNVRLVTKISPTGYLSVWHILGNLETAEVFEGLRSFKPSKGTNLIILLILAVDIEMNPGSRFQCRLCKIYCKASDKVVECEDCEKRFHASCAKLGDNELLKLESGNGSCYCTNYKADWIMQRSCIERSQGNAV